MNSFDSRWPPQTLDLLVRIESETVTGNNYVDWALEALAAGFDFPAMRRLAGLTSQPHLSLSDTEPEFRAAAREIGLPELPREDLLLAFLDESARRIVEGATNLDEILHHIHDMVIDPLDHPEDLMPWCYARGRLQTDDAEPLDDDGVRARKWLDDRRRT